MAGDGGFAPPSLFVRCAEVLNKRIVAPSHIDSDDVDTLRQQEEVLTKPHLLFALIARRSFSRSARFRGEGCVCSAIRWRVNPALDTHSDGLGLTTGTVFIIMMMLGDVRAIVCRLSSIFEGAVCRRSIALVAVLTSFTLCTACGRLLLLRQELLQPLQIRSARCDFCAKDGFGPTTCSIYAVSGEDTRMRCLVLT